MLFLTETDSVTTMAALGQHTSTLFATCLPCEDGGIPLSAFPKDTTSDLAGLFFTLSLLCIQFLSLWHDPTRESNPASTAFAADALTTCATLILTKNVKVAKLVYII